MKLRRHLPTWVLCWLLTCWVRSLAAAAPSATDAALPSRDRFHLFLLIGQSNMAGRGTVTPDDTNAPPRVLMLSREGRWTPARDPLHFDKPVAGVGLGRSFGIAVAAADPGVTVGLIPAAVGGSPIDSWRPGQFYEPTQSHPWDDALERVRQAMKAGTLKGILWHQGESDATPELAPVYAAKLQDLIARIRHELQAPDVPFLIGQLGQFPDSPWTEATRQVDRAHQDLCRQIRHTAFVSSAGLSHNGDRIHFDAPAYREFGRRYAKAYLQRGRRPHPRPATRGADQPDWGRQTA